MSFVFSFIIAESICRILVQNKEEGPEIIARNLYDPVWDESIGYMLKANFSYRAQKYVIPENDYIEKVYDVQYTTDEHQRRVVGQKIVPEAPHILLFGGSFMFGEGLSDQDTLQHQLKLRFPHTNVYNYGVHGKGSTFMLRSIEARDIPNQISSSKGIAIYAFPWFHTYRNIGSPLAAWTVKEAHYEEDNTGRMAYRGIMQDYRPLLSRFNKAYSAARNHSMLLSLFYIDTDSWFFDRFNLTAKIIIETKRRYEENFDGEFIVFNHPLAEAWIPEDERVPVNRIFRQLEKSGVTVLQLPIKIDKKAHTIAHDGHPSAQLNWELAKVLADSEPIKSLLSASKETQKSR